ncbi:MAG: NAD-dependent histone deacetylase sir2 [Bogoriella megaspora]|nr:MAG: NAD-dependent histone deacetylase sir2 [Bogoriella megaspora]
MALVNLQKQPKLEKTGVIDLSSDEDESSEVVTKRVKQQDASNNTDGENASEDEESKWETDSFLNDIIEGGADMELISGLIVNPGPDCCGPEEAAAYRKKLHEVGIEQFVLETITTGEVSARKLLTAFGINTAVFQGGRDEDLYPLLGKAISEELSKRLKLVEYNTIGDAAMLLNRSKNIIVITGAGISTSLGIPDFRSKNTGFYSKLRNMGYADPEEVFDIHNFDYDPTTFYELAGEIVPDLKTWTPTHEFIHLLQQKAKLLTNYTQNIDNLESNAGISPEKLIQCHGSWATATCRKCGTQVPGEEIFEDVKAKKVARCQTCIQRLKNERPGIKRKRSSNDGKKRKRSAGADDDDDDDGRYDIPEPGVMKASTPGNIN